MIRTLLILLVSVVALPACSEDAETISQEDLEQLVNELMEESVDSSDEAEAESPTLDSSLTKSQQNAVKSALSYLEFSGFSRQGLIDQLSSEYGDQYPAADATIAVESLDVDWRAEAVESANSYLEFSAFSCQGLIDQLSSDYGDQYTVEEATYAATQVGLC